MKIEIILRMDNGEKKQFAIFHVPAHENDFARNTYNAACEVAKAMTSYHLQLTKSESVGGYDRREALRSDFENHEGG